ncbi:hypothetical protein N7536_002771 [Penicillium majusculum]|nr:hypothetical protein N7536_002771 [Penicillium majusculum]
MVTPRDIDELDDPPTLDDFLEEAKRFSADEKEQLAIAKPRHKAYYAESTRAGCYDNALETLTMWRTRFYLHQLTDLECFDEAKGWRRGDLMPHEFFTPNVGKCIALTDLGTMATAQSHILLWKSSRMHMRGPKIKLLLISYTGFKYGRIIQASYDGKQLTLQFSQLWSFERNNTAPVELFSRYLLCEAVGQETSTLCVR